MYYLLWIDEGKPEIILGKGFLNLKELVQELFYADKINCATLVRDWHKRHKNWDFKNNSFIDIDPAKSHQYFLIQMAD